MIGVRVAARVAALLSLVGVGIVASSAAQAAEKAFDDPYDLPPVPRPPTLPELTHPKAEGTLEATAGAILPNSGGSLSHGWVQRLSLEIPVGLRRWYVGANYELAAAGGRVVSGNLEIDGRTLWATRTGLAFGGGLGLFVPTAQFAQNSPAGSTALAAATLRPWDVSFFVPNAVGARPFVDVRAIDGAFVVQFRQGLDVLGTADSLGHAYVFATVGVYLGLWTTRAVAAGFEAFESYAIAAPGISDGNRAAVVLSPSVRLVLPWVEPAISAFTNIGTPLQGANDRVWGFRVAFTVAADPAL
jgi:hypothetical protein